ncbi:hypothetical protein ACYSNW_04815 [Enterococcus sp. LJL99]
MAREYINREDTLNAGRVKINRAIDKSYEAEETSSQALEDANKLGNESKAIANQANLKSDAANLKSNNTEKQLNTIILESGTSDAEVVQMRFSEDGTEYAVANERLNAEFKAKANAKNVLYQYNLKQPKILEDKLYCSSTINTNELVFDNVQIPLKVGDKIGIEGVGAPKNFVNFLLVVTGTASKAGSLTLRINDVNHLVNFALGDSANTIASKIKSTITNYNSLIDENRVLFKTTSVESHEVIYSTTDTSVSLAIVVDNVIKYNWLTATVLEVNNQTIKISQNSNRTVNQAEILLDHTDNLKDALMGFGNLNNTFFFEGTRLDIFDKMPQINNKKNIKIYGLGKHTTISFEHVKCTYDPYIFGNNVLYYVDGQSTSFYESQDIIFENLTFKSSDYGISIFRACKNFSANNVDFIMGRAKNVNHIGIGIYDNPYNPDAPGSENFNFTGVDFYGAGMMLISLGDFEKPNKNLYFKRTTFNLDSIGNYGDLNLAEVLKLDNNTDGVLLEDCVFRGGELSSLTIEEGTKNVKVLRTQFVGTKNQQVRIATGQTNKMCRNVLFDSCEFSNFKFGVRVDTSSGWTIDGLTFKDCLVDNGTTDNTSVFLHGSKVNDFNIDGIKIKNSGKMKSAIIILIDSRTGTFKKVDAPIVGNIDVGQIRVLTSENIVVDNCDIATAFFENCPTAVVRRSNIKARLKFIDVLKSDVMFSSINEDDYSYRNYFGEIDITSTKSSTETSVHNIEFNRFFSTKNNFAIKTNNSSIKVNESNNVKRGVE